MMVSIVGEDSCGQGQVKSRFRAVRMTALIRLETTRAISPNSRTRPPPQSLHLEKSTSVQKKAHCKLDAKYKTEHISYLLLFFLSCWGEWLTRGREKGLCVWLLDLFLRLDYSYIHSLKDSDSPKDTEQPGANLLNQTQDVLTFLSLASTTFKSSS